MPWLILSAFIIGLSVGFAGTYARDSRKIAELESSINLSNKTADALLQSSISAKEKADAEAEELKQQIEVSHAKAIQSANALTDRVAVTAARVYAGRKNCSNAMSASSDTAEPEATAADEFKRKAERLAEELGRTDAYAQSCWQFVPQSNCGINDGR